MVRKLSSLALAVTLTSIAAAAPTSTTLTITKKVPLGSPEGWDYLTFDADAHRVYVAHGGAIEAIDATTGKVEGKAEVPGSNGMATLAALGKGYAGSRAKKAVIVFDLKTFKALKSIPVEEDTDAVVYDPKSTHVFVMHGDPQSVTAIDTAKDVVAGTVKLTGQPEFAAADGAGHLYVNIVEKPVVERLNTATLKSEGVWPVAGCDRPHGLAMDLKSQRLFVGCVNELLYVLDAGNGSIVAKLPIGKRSDAIAFDAKRQLVFSSNGEGTLSVYRETSPSKFESLGTPATQATARTMTLNPVSGTLYLTAGEQVLADPAATDPRKKFKIAPGSVTVLFAELTLPAP
jgi:DNA-binding beta-propeller fold protein YncE